MRTASTQGYGQLGRYELLARIAVGGMGEIFLARLSGAEGFEKLYVVKRILPHLADDPRFRTMLIDEARISAKMAHPNICQVYELGETAGQLYIVMEYLEGVTLLDAIRQAARSKHPMALGLVAGVLQQASDALHYAHELTERDGTPLQVIHRDVTPSNLFLTETGVVKVLDFGIAKVRTATQSTQAGTVKGKYAYMAPEQMQSGNITPRVDVFAAGVVGFEMLALRRLFQRRTDYLTFRALMELPVPNIREFRAEVPPAFAEVLARALERDPIHRYASVREFARAVQDAIVGHARVWSASEISDYLRTAFRDELRTRAAAIAQIVRYGSGTTGRATLPLLAAFESGVRTNGDDDEGPDDDFPSIETGVHDVAEMAAHGNAEPVTLLAPNLGSSAHIVADDVRRTGAVKSLRAPAPVVVAQPQRRSWIVPVVGLSILVAGGVSMFALWLNRTPAAPLAPTQIVIERANSSAIDARPTADLTIDATRAAGIADARRPVGKIDARPRTTPTGDPRQTAGQQVRSKLAAQLGAIKSCLIDAGATTGSTTLAFDVSATGQASGASIKPNSSAVPCIRGVIHGIEFGPLAGGGMRFEIPLNVD